MANPAFFAPRIAPAFGGVRRDMGAVRELRLVLTVADVDAALAFYRDALGLEELEAWEADSGRIAILAAGAATIELVDEGQAAAIDRIEVGRRVAGPVRLALEVADSPQAARQLVAAGAELPASRRSLLGHSSWT